MATIKCKMCGGNIEAVEGATFATCEHCGTTSTLPKASDERKANLFNRANHFRRQNDFDKAMQAYENILNEDSSAAEAHWGVVLSKYGIEYVEDPATRQKVPTCHCVQSESILADADYLAALENAEDSYTRSLYEDEAKKISEIQKGILAISSKEQPYDVFICYKETGENGDRTKDSVIAQDIHDHLAKEGLRVFFARITLEDKLGQQYEPYIFSALNSAKVMLAIGTRKEHFEAVWVKNEWSRFLALRKKDPSRTLIPCYRDMDPYDLPDELANLGLQAQDMGKIGFVQDLIRNLKKIFGEESISDTKQNADNFVPPKMFADATLKSKKTDLEKKIQEAEERKINSGQSLDWAENNLRFAEDGLRQSKKMRDAYDAQQRREEQEKRYTAGLNRGGMQGLFDEVRLSVATGFIGVNPHVEFVAKAQQEVNEAHERILSTKSFIAEVERELIRYKAELKNIEDLLRMTPAQRTENHYQNLLHAKNSSSDGKNAVEFAVKFREMEGYKDTEALAKESEDKALKMRYERLVEAKSKASTEYEYRDLTELFRSMNGYENTGELAVECDNQYRVLKEQREERERIERERRAERERIIKEEEERRQAEQTAQWERERKKEEAEKHHQRNKRKLVVCLSFLPLTAIILGALSGAVGILVLLIPLAIVHLVNDGDLGQFFRVIATIISVIGFGVVAINIGAYNGGIAGVIFFIALVIGLIMAFKVPLKRIKWFLGHRW